MTIKKGRKKLNFGGQSDGSDTSPLLYIWNPFTKIYSTDEKKLNLFEPRLKVLTIKSRNLREI